MFRFCFSTGMSIDDYRNLTPDEANLGVEVWNKMQEEQK